MLPISALDKYLHSKLKIKSQLTTVRRGLITGMYGDVGVVAVFFRPTGITFEGRPANIEAAAHYDYADLRFSADLCTEGKGSGGMHIEVYKQVPHKRSRIDLLTERPTNKELLIGSIGWLPREMAPILRPLMWDCPYAITHAVIEPYTKSLCLCLVVWDVPREGIDRIEDQVMDFDIMRERTNLNRWDTCSMLPTRIDIPGYLKGSELHEY